MKVSYNWLNNYFEQKLPPVEAVADALTFHAFEIDGIDPHGADSVLDVKVTPNRGHDCLCHRGIAKELSAILKLPMTVPHDPFARKPDFSKKAEEVSVKLSTPLCKRYIAAHIKNVNVGPSPEWLKNSLEAIGQKSINNIVDATNMVMFNLGQPLHAFDAAKLGSLDIGVRPAKQGEQMAALDDKVYALQESNLVITAGDIPVGIAGVKGGKASGITEETKDIIVESANFDGVSTRKTAQALKLRTDASARFEQVISPELAAYGMQQVVETILAVAGGEVAGFVDVYPEPQQPTYVSVTVEQVNKILGLQLTAADIADVFQRLQFAYKETDGVFEVQPPAERLDLVISEDLVEEVGRIIGYDKVPATPLPAFSKTPEINPEFYAAEKAREELMAQGYSEVFTSVFAEQGERTVLNKVDGIKPHLRQDLKTGLLEAWNKNQPNKDVLGLKEVKLFEIGAVWANGKEETHIATVNGKGVVEEKKLEPVSADAYDALALSPAQQYKAFSRYPYIVRDVSMWIPSGMEAGEVVGLLQKNAGELATKIMPLDRFEKGDRVSLAFRIIFQSFDRTLEDSEANSAMEKVHSALKEKGFEIR